MDEVFFYNGPVLTLDGDTGVIPCGWLSVSAGRVTGYGEYDPQQIIIPQGVEAVDLRGRLLMPGLVNVHTHAAMSLMRGLADDLPLMEWLNDYIFKAEKSLSPEWARIGTELACLEMIRSGTTCASDMYIFENSVLEVFDRSGMRAICGEAVYDFPSPCYGAPENAWACLRELKDRWSGHSRVRLAVTPHAPYTCSPDLLVRLHQFARDSGLLLHVHVSETQHEVAMIRERYGKTPLMHLDDLGLVDGQLLAAHGVWLTEEEIALAAAKGVSVAHCPESNLKLGSGFAPVPKLLAAGVNVGLGTDGCASNNNLDMFVEMDYAAKIHKGVALDPTVTNDRQVLRMATVDAARALGMEDVAGSLAVGKPADLIIIDFSAAHLRPVYDYVSHIVYSVNGSDVSDTMVAGKWLMRNRRILTLEEDKVFFEAEQLGAAIRQAVGGSRGR